MSILKKSQRGVIAVGDGANDASMIQKASVGIGIVGKEGMVAANASDVSLERIKYIENILLVHGVWNYVRLAKMVIFVIYKSLLVTFTAIIYMLLRNFFPILPYSSIGYSLNNFLFTTIQVLAVAIYSQKGSYLNRLDNPKSFSKFVDNPYLNRFTLLSTLVKALIQSLIVVFLLRINLADSCNFARFKIRAGNELGYTPHL